MKMEDREKLHHDDFFDRFLDRAVDAVLREPPPEELPPEQVDELTAVVRRAAEKPRPITLLKRSKNMKRIAQMTIATTVLAAIGIFAFWMVSGGSDNLAFARVAEALDSLRSATFDITTEAKGENGQPPAIATGKGFFLAPSHQRMEVTVDMGYEPAIKAAEAAARRAKGADSPEGKAAAKAAAEAMTKAVADLPKIKFKQITISDGQTDKCITLTPMAKIAKVMDMKKMKEDMKKAGKLAKNAPPDMFEMVRRIVREGSSGSGEKVERLGKKEIDGRETVGFRTRFHGMNMILWADPETACPVRIESSSDMMNGVHMVMDNFRYDVDLDPTLFSLEPPKGYSTQTMNMKMPVEEDLLNTLRTIAEHNKGKFPAKFGMNDEVMNALMPPYKPVMDPEMQAEMKKVMEKITAKYGGEEKLRAKYGKGKKLPPEIMAEFMKATMTLQQKHMQKQMQKSMKTTTPLIRKRTRGITFYTMLKPENDPHYVGGGVKLGTPNRPILWYKPTGGEKYHVIYADLSVKQVSAEELPKLPQAEDNPKP
ncbi:MAG: hypothetical protein JXM70_05545 [Pirellulales bacterium]|nr:hypothetical protein [Pirellulales bacterium]